MSLTPAQLTTLKAAILAETDPAFVVARTDGNNEGMLAFFNAIASPAYIVWSNRLTRKQATALGFDWTQVDNLTNGQARIWDGLFDNEERSIDCTDAGQRAGLSEAWRGTAAKVAVGTFVLGQGKRSALRIERLFAVGSGTLVSPSTPAYVGELSGNDLLLALSQK